MICASLGLTVSRLSKRKRRLLTVIYPRSQLNNHKKKEKLLCKALAVYPSVGRELRLYICSLLLVLM